MAFKDSMKITLLDAAVLVNAAVKAAESKDIGWLDADHPLGQFRAKMNEKIDVDVILVESALSCFAELENVNKFQHPDGLNFESFVQKIKPWGMRYNPLYRLFEKEVRK